MKQTDHEAQLFSGSSEKAKQLHKESKRVRRLADRRAWWQQHGKPPASAPGGKP
jgi:hypothetical protein